MLNWARHELELTEGLNHEGIIDTLIILYNQSHSNHSMKFVIEMKCNIKSREETEKTLMSQDCDEYTSRLCKARLKVYDAIQSNNLNERDVEALYKLIQYRPLTPLTFESDEWNYVGDDERGKVFQNRRMSRVFKIGENGSPYFLDAIIKKVKRPITGKYSCWGGAVTIKETGERVSGKAYIKDPKFIEPIGVFAEEVEIYPNNWEMCTTLSEIEKVKEHYELIIIKK